MVKKSIYKYPLSGLLHIHSITVPKGSTPLKIAVQEGGVVVWAEVPLGVAEVEEIRFYGLATGCEVPAMVQQRFRYMDTTSCRGIVSHWYVEEDGE